MTFLSFIIFLPVMASGTLILHLLWPEKNPLAFLLKFSLGIGLGLGINSILYFQVIQIVPGRINPLIPQIILLIFLLAFTFLRERSQKSNETPLLKLSRLQLGLVGISLLAFLISLLIFTNTILARPQGEYDAWSIWNRAARFIYRDPENWRATLSPDLELFTHADYPLLVPLNVAWGWEVLGKETLRLPMVQSGLFTFSLILLMFSALALTRTIGQASLASIVLMANPNLILTGANLTADIPITYFIFASTILIYLFSIRGNYAFLVLSGFMAGLAGWTKNEGLLLIAIGPIAVIVASPRKIGRSLLHYLAGLAIPLTIILYFKSITPINDLMNDNSFIAKVSDLSRYWVILESFRTGIFNTNLMIFLCYVVLMRDHLITNNRWGIYAISSILVLQLLGYFAIYVITPNDLEWHLFTSLGRLILQILPVGIFLCFSVIADPESAFN